MINIRTVRYGLEVTLICLIDWSSNSIVSHQYSKQINECFIDTFDYCCLDQIVDFPTRKQNTLDILATNRPTLVNKCSPHPGVSDHDTTVLADIDCHPMRSKPVKRKIFLWNKTDINKLKDHVSTKVDKFVQIHDINTPVNFLWADLKQIIDTSMLLVPSKLTSPRYSQPWITRECKRLSRRKKRAYNRAKRTSRKEDWDKFKSLTTKSRKACKLAYNKYVEDSVSPDIKRNPKRFFTFIKNRKCDNNGISPLRDQGQIHIDDTSKANILNRNFPASFQSRIQSHHH